MNKMKNNRYLRYAWIIFVVMILAIISWFCGIDSYQSKLIAVKHIDGKYGKRFYGVEVFGKEVGNRIEIYARIGIGGVDRMYCHNCGKIGVAADWEKAKEKFGDISFDGNILTIGTYSIEKKVYEGHR